MQHRRETGPALLVLWGDTLVDGHNRYEICTAHDVPFQTVQKDFADRDDALRWIILNQFGRRNLPAYERARLALRLKPVIAEKAKAKEASHTEQGYQKSENPVHTAKELAKAAGVSHDTIAKVEKIERQAAPVPVEIVGPGRRGAARRRLIPPLKSRLFARRWATVCAVLLVEIG